MKEVEPDETKGAAITERVLACVDTGDGGGATDVGLAGGTNGSALLISSIIGYSLPGTVRRFGSGLWVGFSDSVIT